MQHHLFEMLRYLIRNQRLRKGWTIRQLALYSGVHHSQLSRFEAGNADLHGKAIEKVMKALEFSVYIGDQCVWQGQAIESDDQDNLSLNI